MRVNSTDGKPPGEAVVIHFCTSEANDLEFLKVGELGL